MPHLSYMAATRTRLEGLCCMPCRFSRRRCVLKPNWRSICTSPSRSAPLLVLALTTFFCSFLSWVAEGSETRIPMRLAAGSTLEVCIAQWWASLGAATARLQVRLLKLHRLSAYPSLFFYIRWSLAEFNLKHCRSSSTLTNYSLELMFGRICDERNFFLQ